MQTHFSTQQDTQDLKSMTGVMLLVEQSIIDFFVKHDQPQVDITVISQVLAPALSNHGKSEELLNRFLPLLPCVVM